ncbi:unnamed protein product [Pylaiella littoralis]
MDGDDFYTGAEEVPATEGAPEGGGYNDIGSGEYGNNGGDYGGADFSNGGGGFDQQANGDVQQANSNGFDSGMGFQQDNMGYANLDEPSGGSGGNGMENMPAPEDVEPSALDEFMERWQAGLNEKAGIEAEAKAAALEAAKADLESHAIERASNKEAKMGQNREQEQVFLEQLEGELESENPWERVVSLVDTQTEVVEEFQDTSRMTSILIQLKNEPLDSASTAAAS